MTKQLLPALRAMILLTVLTGLIYPGVVTGLCQVLFRDKANGSLVRRDGRIVGSALLGQNFSRAEYFHPRPSAAGTDGYDATASGGSNLGPTSRKLHDRVKASVEQFRKENPSFTGAIPADALTASASGLDPEISVANAEAQIARIADARKAKREQVESLVRSHTKDRDLGILGEPRVNVLSMNLELDRQFPER
jgi:potassium-transporting ATPase KdpC subunit